MNGGFHPRDCVARLYVLRKDGGRGLISVEDCVDQARISLENYVQSSEEELLKTVRREGVESQETAAGFKARRRAENIQEWKEKPLYGQFARQDKHQRSEETWAWLKEGKLKRERETEALIVATQNQAIRTNYVKATIDKSQADPNCRICKQGNEIISHIVNYKLAQKEYKRRPDNVARAIHWDMLGKCGLSQMRGGMTMLQKVCLKMTTTNFCGTLVCEQTMKLGQGDLI